MHFSKIFTTTVIACLAATPLAASLQARDDPQCDTTSKSPGSANVLVAADKIGQVKDGCSHDGSGTTQMSHEDGIRIYLMGNAGSTSCSKVADALRQLVKKCQKNVDGDIRTGGSIQMPENAGTWINVSQ